MSRPTIHIHRESFSQPDIDGLVLYRCYGLDGTLMYVGKTTNLANRIKSHASDKPWWFAVEHITAQPYRNRRVLDQDELRAIAFERPFFNKAGRAASYAIIGRGTVWNRQRQIETAKDDPARHAEEVSSL